VNEFNVFSATEVLHHATLKQQIRLAKTDKELPESTYLGVDLVFFAELLYNRGGECFVRDGRTELFQITNRRANG